MRITEIKILNSTAPNVLARVSIVIDDMLEINGFAIMPGRNDGLFLAMPSHNHSDGSRRDTVHTKSQEIRQYLEKKIFDAFRAGGIEPKQCAQS